MDFVACWYQNPFDAITAQNSLYNARGGWLNNMIPWIDGKGADQDDRACKLGLERSESKP